MLGCLVLSRENCQYIMDHVSGGAYRGIAVEENRQLELGRLMPPPFHELERYTVGGSVRTTMPSRMLAFRLLHYRRTAHTWRVEFMKQYVPEMLTSPG